MRNILSDRKFLSVYLIWVLLHSLLLLNGSDYNGFWPINNDDIDYYGLSEWLIYVFGPILLTFLRRAFRNENNKETTIILLLLSYSLTAKSQLNAQDQITVVPNKSEYHLEEVKLNMYDFDELSKIINEPSYNYPVTKTQTVQQDPLKELAEWAEQPASYEAQMQPEYINLEATNADRFINSPCYRQIGFNPHMDPVLQEKVYTDCENSIKEGKIKQGALIAILIGAIIFFVAYKRKAEINNPQ